MRILIFASDQNADALKLRDELKAEGHHASFRNPQYFDGRPESCDEAYTDDQRIAEAYDALRIPVKGFSVAIKSKPQAGVRIEVTDAFDESIPDGFPGAQALEAAGILMFGQLPETIEGLTAIKGIGPATANAILAELEGE